MHRKQLASIALAAAHRSLPLGTRARVTDLETGRQVEVTINDRGPFAEPERQVIDLSQAAAARIGMVRRGVGPVRVTVLDVPRPRKAAPRGVQRRLIRGHTQPLTHGCWPHVPPRRRQVRAHPLRTRALWTAGSRRPSAWPATEGRATPPHGRLAGVSLGRRHGADVRSPSAPCRDTRVTPEGECPCTPG